MNDDPSREPLADNPYAAPVAAGLQSRQGDASVSSEIVESLRRTRPWVLGLAIVGLLMGAICAVVGGMALVGSLRSGYGSTGQLIGLIYLAFAPMFAMPAWRLRMFGASIAKLADDAAPTTLFEVMEHQRRFWRVLALMLLAFVGAWFAFFFALSAGFTH
jgi:hypothetical protein